MPMFMLTPHRYLRTVLAALALLTVAGCVGVNPVAIAETPAQKADMISASYNIVLESATEIIEDENAPLRLRRALQDIVAETAPVIDALDNIFADYVAARAAWELAGTATAAERLEVVSANLDAWIAEAQGALIELDRALDD